MKYCTNMYLDNLYNPTEGQGHMSRSHGFFVCLYVHDTAANRGQPRARVDDLVYLFIYLFVFT